MHFKRHTPCSANSIRFYQLVVPAQSLRPVLSPTRGHLGPLSSGEGLQVEGEGGREGGRGGGREGREGGREGGGGREGEREASQKY